MDFLYLELFISNNLIAPLHVRDRESLYLYLELFISNNLITPLQVRDRESLYWEKFYALILENYFTQKNPAKTVEISNQKLLIQNFYRKWYISQSQ